MTTASDASAGNRNESKAPRIVFAGGGTGGHIFLAIALAREMVRRNGAADVLFVGTQRGLESKIVPREGFRLEYIVSAGLKGMKLWSVLRNFLMIPGSLWQSGRLLRRFRPHVVVGVGGYSSGPVVLAAWWLGCATLVIEPNAHPGLTNRWLAHVVDRAALALPDEGGYFGSKGIVTGIPVRDEFRSVPRRVPGTEFTVLIYGGSQGSHALNAIVCDAIEEIKTLEPSVRLIHQTGEREFEAVNRSHRNAGLKSDVRPFLPSIFEEFARADLIVSRAGAGTVAELTVAGKAAILVPFPGAADNHQTRNALALERYGAARMIPEQEWVPGRLAREIRHYMQHREELERMEQASRKLARPDATERIADMIEKLAAAQAGVAAQDVSF
jgi:UDP-N-acetylglucosamine--N-acetylmuramyl-(pentapeptide) pyrophosphoryl-undecaprenol N-acetylglucosamine transferase